MTDSVRHLLIPGLSLLLAGLACPAATLASGTTPNPYSFAVRRDATPGSTQISDPSVLYGLDSPAPLSISGGSYSLNGAAFTSSAGVAQSGDVLRVKRTASTGYASNATATVTVGGVVAPFVVTTVARRTTPALFRFAPQLGALPSVEYSSAAIVVGGVNAPTPIAIGGGRYSVNGGAWTSSAGSVANGDSIRVAVVASALSGGAASANLTIGGVSAQFAVVNSGADTVPDAFSFPGPVSGLPKLAQLSAPVTVTGIGAPAPISSPDGTLFSINGGPYSEQPGVVNAGDRVSLYVVAGSALGNLRSGSVTIGGVSASFSVSSSAPADSVPDAFGFADATAPPGTAAVSAPVLVSNVNVATPITVSGALYNINGGAYLADAGSVKAGDVVTMQLVAPATAGQSASATLTIGDSVTRSGTWKLTAQPASSPSAFTLLNANQYKGSTVPPGSLVTTAPVIVANAGGPVTVKVSGGLYSINGGRFVATGGTVSNGDSVVVQAVAASTYATSTSVKLTLGAVSSTLTVETCKDTVAATPTAFTGTVAYIYRNTSPVPLRVFVALPSGWAATDRRAARVQFFGGGFNHGDPTSAVGSASYWAKHSGMVGFAPDYRVNDRFGSAPMLLADDNRLVVKWVMDNASTLGVDPLRVVVAGGSSGGGSAFFAAKPTPPATTDPANSPPYPLAAIAIRAGAVNLTPNPSYAVPGLDYFYPVSASISPAQHLDPKMPPVIMSQGDADELVPQSRDIAVCNALLRAGTRCDFHNVPGGVHSFSSAASSQANADEEAFMTSVGVLPSLR